MAGSESDSLLDYPCDFPIKAMGVADDGFDSLIVSIVRAHVEDIGEGALKTRPSRNGKYLSVTVTINEQSQRQIDDLYRELSGHKQVLMVL